MGTSPPEGIVKLNIDGVSKEGRMLAGVGCVHRDHQGSWLMGLARNLGFCHALEAELWAALIGLVLAWEEGLKHIILETDSYEVKEILEEPVGLNNPYYALIDRCKNLLGRRWIVEIMQIYREANTVADGIAN